MLLVRLGADVDAVGRKLCPLGREVGNAQAGLPGAGGLAGEAGCSASRVVPVSNSAHSGVWNFSVRPTVSRQKATAAARSDTLAMTYFSSMDMESLPSVDA